jgi:hypothetical protein
VDLPVVPNIGDTFYIDPDYGGMRVIGREVTAPDSRPTIIVESSGCSDETLGAMGFTVDL